MSLEIFLSEKGEFIVSVADLAVEFLLGRLCFAVKYFAHDLFSPRITAGVSDLICALAVRNETDLRCDLRERLCVVVTKYFIFSGYCAGSKTAGISLAGLGQGLHYQAEVRSLDVGFGCG